MTDKNIFTHREHFENVVFFERFVRELDDCPDKAKFLKRDPEDSKDYEDPHVSAMWFGWNLALKHVVSGTANAPQLQNLLCPACKQPQIATPSGASCINGHGGLEGIEA
jgi:hypothetical protein